MKNNRLTGFTTIDSLIGLTIIVMFSFLYSEMMGTMNHKIQHSEEQMQRARIYYEKKQVGKQKRLFNDR